ncbi:MAG: hypothetical protein ABIK23_02245 [candidate division WOR-3 bacterium]
MSKKVVYSLNVDDLQMVAKDCLNRRLTPDEINAIERKLDDFIDWYEAIQAAINEVVK